jgi:hypothetical protein
VNDGAPPASNEVGAPPADALSGDSGSAADTANGATGMFVATVKLDKLFENCMPIVAADPLQVSGTLEVMNTGAVAIGPLTAMEGILTTDGLVELGHFALGAVTIPAVPPGQSQGVTINKVSGSLMGGQVCGPGCGMLVRIRVPISGDNVPAGAIASSPLQPLSCPM